MEPGESSAFTVYGPYAARRVPASIFRRFRFSVDQADHKRRTEALDQERPGLLWTLLVKVVPRPDVFLDIEELKRGLTLN